MSNKISRRNFLHTAGLGTLGAAAAGLLTACGDKAASGSVASSAAAGTYTAGTYSATATGINTTTPVTVTMTFSADAITDVQIDVANETKGYGADIADEMVKKILDAQSSEVDGHSGATITSDAIKKAAESCINQAKGVAVAPTEASKAETVVPDGLTTEEVESSVVELGDITPDETKDFDVVVVGAGAAGVPAAGWAAELGGHVALLQKQSIVVSQGNCGSAIIKSKSTEAGKKMHFRFVYDHCIAACRYCDPIYHKWRSGCYCRCRLQYTIDIILRCSLHIIQWNKCCCIIRICSQIVCNGKSCIC